MIDRRCSSFGKAAPGRAPWVRGLAAAACLLLAGCGAQMQFPVSDAAQERLPNNIDVIKVSTRNIDHVRGVYYESPARSYAAPPPDAGRYVYRVGPGDELRIKVWTTPERAPEADNPLAPQQGFVVDSTGQFFYPFVGAIQAEGRTVGDIRAALTQRLRAYITDPQVEVSVQDFRAHRVMAVGAVGTPGPIQLSDVPLRLIDVLNSAGLAGGADLTRVELRRAGIEYSADVTAFLEHGDMRQNPVVQPGDVIFVPERLDDEVFVFGEIATTEVPLGGRSKSLTELLAEVGGIDRARANAKGIFVFRRSPVRANGFDVFQFDLSDASTLVLMSGFPLMPLDIVFVTKDPITQWSDTVGRLLIPARTTLAAQAVAGQIVD